MEIEFIGLKEDKKKKQKVYKMKDVFKTNDNIPITGKKKLEKKNEKKKTIEMFNNVSPNINNTLHRRY